MKLRTRRVAGAALSAALAACLAGAVHPLLAQSGLLLVALGELDGPATARDLADTLVDTAETGVVPFNVSYTGDPRAIGTFSGGAGILDRPEVDETPVRQGIVLSSGRVVDAAGPNDSIFTTTSFCIPPGGEPDCVPNGDSDLDLIVAPRSTFDAAVLQFDFVPPLNSNVVRFRYVFASEEYNEFANSPFNNVFAFYVNGVNYALLPDGITPVSINNVNGGNPPGVSAHNDERFRDNEGTITGSSVTGAPINIEADGLTVILEFRAPVIPNTMNHMKLAIADTQDHIYDSWAFLEHATFTEMPEECGDLVDNNFDGFVDEGCGQTSDPQTIAAPNEDHTFTFTNLGRTETLTLILTERTTLRPHRLQVIATLFDPRDLQLPLTNPNVFPFGTTCLPTNTTDGSERPCVLFSVIDADTGQPPIAGVDYTQQDGAIRWIVDTPVTKPVSGNVGMGHFRSDAVQTPVDFVDENILLVFDEGVGESDNYSGVTLTVSPATAPPTLTLPDPIVAEATGPSGANVDYEAIAYGTVAANGPLEEPAYKEIPISCEANLMPVVPGSLFPIGNTSVSCSATGSNGKTTTGSFLVTVEDTTPPALILPVDIAMLATTATGATVPYIAAASDLVDGSLAVACTPASGSLFPFGTTAVACGATDAAGNSSSGSFNVSVGLLIAGPHAPYAPPPARFNGGRTLPLKWQYAGGDGVIDTPLANPVVTYAGPFACGAAAAGSPTPAIAPGASGPEYDAATGTWHVNWKIPGLPSGCYAITIANQQANVTHTVTIRIGR